MREERALLAPLLFHNDHRHPTLLTAQSGHRLLHSTMAFPCSCLITICSLFVSPHIPRRDKGAHANYTRCHAPEVSGQDLCMRHIVCLMTPNNSSPFACIKCEETANL